MPKTCFERFVKFQAKSHLSRQHKKKRRKKEKKFFHTNKQNIQKILASKISLTDEIKPKNIKM